MKLASILVYVAWPLLLPCAVAEDPILSYTCTAEKSAMFPGGWPKALDSGIYWFGRDNQIERATGNKSSFYDPSRKTIVFMDGFNGLYHVRSCHRMTSKCVQLARCEGDLQYIANDWVERGYNFGIFFWDQFADEDCYFEAELKVWGYKWGHGPQDKYMTWKSYDTVTKKTEKKVYKGPETSVSELCASSLRAAMPFFHGGSMQIAGFSLGAQLAAACADVMYQQTPTHPAVPTLMNLLEPAFTAHFKPWSAAPFHPCQPMVADPKQTVRWTVAAVERLWEHKVPLALYKSSELSRVGSVAHIIFDPGVELDVLGTLVRWTPSFCGGPFSFPCQHDVIVPFFFFSMRDTRPTLENVGPTSGQCTLPGPLCSDAEILAMATQRRAGFADGTQHLWKQVSGMKTWTLEDDVFRWDVTADPKVPLDKSFANRLYNLGGFAAALARSPGTVAPVLIGFSFVACLGFFSVRRRRSSVREDTSSLMESGDGEE